MSSAICFNLDQSKILSPGNQFIYNAQNDIGHMGRMFKSSLSRVQSEFELLNQISRSV